MDAPQDVKDMGVEASKPDMVVSTKSADIEDPAEAAFAKQVLRKIDMRLLPILFVTFNFNFIDKTILSSASVFGLSTDTVCIFIRSRLNPEIDIFFTQHLVGNQYSWVSSMFYFGYFFWEYPTTVLIQKLPVGKYVAADIITWGAIVGKCQSHTFLNYILK